MGQVLRSFVNVWKARRGLGGQQEERGGVSDLQLRVSADWLLIVLSKTNRRIRA